MKKFNFKIFLGVLLVCLFFSNSGISQTRIAILYSTSTEKISEDKAKEVLNQITFWELYFMQYKLHYHVIYDDDIDDEIEEDFDIIILPSVEALNEEQKNSLKIFVNSGKSILSSKSRFDLINNEDYTINSSSKSIFDFDIEFIDASISNALQTLDYNYITKSDPKFDNQILLTTKNGLNTADVKSNKIFSLGYLEGEEVLSDLSSVVCGRDGTGKFVWLGFNQDDIIGGTEDINEYKNLLLNSLQWLDILPDAGIDFLPSNYQSSTVILLELNNFLEIELIDKLHSEGYKPQLVFSLNQNISEEIRSKFNIEDYILDLSSFGNDIELQKIISDTLQYFNNQYGITIENIILSKKDLTNSEKDLLKKSGIKTILFNSNYSGLPTILSDKLVAFPFNKTNSKHGLINYRTYSPKINCNSSSEDEFLLQIAKLNNTGSWFSNLNALNKWWLIRENLQTKLVQDENENLAINISNNNPSDINDISIIIDLPANINPGLVTAKEGNQLLDFSLDSNTGLMKLNIESLKARQTKKILITAN